MPSGLAIGVVLCLATVAQPVGQGHSELGEVAGAFLWARPKVFPGETSFRRLKKVSGGEADRPEAARIR